MRSIVEPERVFERASKTFSRQVTRAKLRKLNFEWMSGDEKHHGRPLRSERRQLARAFAIGAWRNRVPVSAEAGGR